MVTKSKYRISAEAGKDRYKRKITLPPGFRDITEENVNAATPEIGKTIVEFYNFAATRPPASSVALKMGLSRSSIYRRFSALSLKYSEVLGFPLRGPITRLHEDYSLWLQVRDALLDPEGPKTLSALQTHTGAHINTVQSVSVHVGELFREIWDSHPWIRETKYSKHIPSLWLSLEEAKAFRTAHKPPVNNERVKVEKVDPTKPPTVKDMVRKLFLRGKRAHVIAKLLRVPLPVVERIIADPLTREEAPTWRDNMTDMREIREARWNAMKTPSFKPTRNPICDC